jgi:hypothetical protein
MSQAHRNALEEVRHHAQVVQLNGGASRLAELAAPFEEEIIATALEVMRDKGTPERPNRQRLNAAAFLAQLRQQQPVNGNAGGGEVRVVVVSQPDIQKLGEMERQARLEAKAK